ncbi:polysaccharide deacetylase family protein [Actinoplanes awajinensis]|uniref:NodB homology domain-containing protein n=1 Tax=Actinoplanes awajinensis subsp. mycoplanecinus TaxID=135947 RepID=A0A101JCS2_9ACTN|nr:polysaccharide deacetylase family protein [Actinoplanes awajinensis]KUL24396.1 hypothetical protein ADL15_43640 [Actinoplanes awajinensis subsp. mycoplanecinus]
MHGWKFITPALSGCLLLVGGGASASAADGPRVGVSAVQYDSPGATVPAIVTVYNIAKGTRVVISATGTAGSTVTCSGPVWKNPVRHTASRTCYLRLPAKAGKYAVRGTATLTRNGSTRTVSGAAGRPVVADGKISEQPMSPATIRQIERCQNTTSDVWLTFDDSGSAKQVKSILATLKRNNVKGHFFFRGDWARQHPKLFSSITAAGHVIGNHTSTHPALSRMGKTNLTKQIDAGTAATGEPKLLRPPFGAGAFSTRLVDIAAARGYQLCRWTTDTVDWDHTPTKVMVERVTYGDYRTAPLRAGGVLLMHGHGRYTASGLQQIINAVRAKGLTPQRLK